jgi:AraC family transcriptional regulator
VPICLSCGSYYGETVRRRRVADLVLTETRYAANAELPRHCHEHAYFCLVRRGGYAETYGTQLRTCGPMTLAYHPPQEVHAQQMGDAEVRSFNVEVTPPWWERLEGTAALRQRGTDFSGGPATVLGVRLHEEFRHFDDASPLAVEGLVLELLAAVVRSAAGEAEPKPPAWLLRVRDRLHDEFADPPRLADLATNAGVHPVYLAAAFRRHFRCTAGEYVRRRRIDWACKRLAEGELSLAEVALAAGFSDQSHFGRIFKRLVGLTPAAYRDQLA